MAEFDVLIVGSGPVGSAFAHELVVNGKVDKVCLVEAGAQLTQRRGEHLKNSFFYQRDVDPFASVIRGHLEPLSVPPDQSTDLTLDPIAFNIIRQRFVRNGQNPNQDPAKNLPAAAATYSVGGMATHWTCATPRPHKIERTDIFNDDEWNEMLTQAEEKFGTTRKAFDDSVRNYVVKEVLKKGFRKDEVKIESLPLACKRTGEENRYVQWAGADTILKELADEDYSKRRYPGFIFKPQHRCNKLILSQESKKIEAAEIEDVMEGKKFRVKAKVFILACGAVLTPQVLWESGIRPEPLGRYLTEQPMAFCQIVLKKEIVEAIRHIQVEPYKSAVEAHIRKNPLDPVPIPAHDQPPQVTIPVSENRPWHTQIHRDAFSYGDIKPSTDSRVIVDLRWFAKQEPRRENRVWFTDKIRDKMGMAQPTFEYSLSKKDAKVVHRMFLEMQEVASVLGGILPESPPQIMSPGLTLHITGTVRMGTSPTDSVVNKHSKVWGYDNLFLGGNGVIPTGTACNPTLTSVGFALYACKAILSELQRGIPRSPDQSYPRVLPDSKYGIVLEFPDPEQVPVVVSPPWSIKDWNFQFIQLHSHAEFLVPSPPSKSIHLVKVLGGTIANLNHLGTVTNPLSRRKVVIPLGVTKLVAGVQGALFVLETVDTKGINDKIQDMESVKLQGPYAGTVKWILYGDLDPKFKGVDFWNLRGFKLFGPRLKSLGYAQFWTIAPGLDAGYHDHSNLTSETTFGEIHQDLYNGNGHGGMQWTSKSRATPLVPLPWGFEHGPLWNVDFHTGDPIYTDQGIVSYPMHRWIAGGIKDSLPKVYDVWVAWELVPSQLRIPSEYRVGDVPDRERLGPSKL